MIKFKTHNETKVDICGTSYIAMLYESYDNLVEIFGEPHESDGYKVDAEWGIVFADGQVATIYNWKDGKNYLGEDGALIKDIKEWHIGGNNRVVVERIEKIIAEKLPKITRENKIKLSIEKNKILDFIKMAKEGKGDLYIVYEPKE